MCRSRLLVVQTEGALQVFDGCSKRRASLLTFSLRLKSTSERDGGAADRGRKRSSLDRFERHF